MVMVRVRVRVRVRDMPVMPTWTFRAAVAVKPAARLG